VHLSTPSKKHLQRCSETDEKKPPTFSAILFKAVFIKCFRLIAIPITPGVFAKLWNIIAVLLHIFLKFYECIIEHACASHTLTIKFLQSWKWIGESTRGQIGSQCRAGRSDVSVATWQAMFPSKVRSCANAQCHQPICAVKSHSHALAKFQI